MAAEIHHYSYVNERELNAHSPACSTIGLNGKKNKNEGCWSVFKILQPSPRFICTFESAGPRVRTSQKHIHLILHVKLQPVKVATG